ncbi:hypothetical protein JCGZ_02121 [Jatropha curcas]|uniref:Uncharacterized protein n=1 Tax=Jatropha curcas TaxID=180498 RepID=A0A067KYS4_JATCU|nr:uncharacterized protein LOC105631933 [Jatropha curcas]KDP40123.1 hypothetical protein JCGZ_02121 [Jatropha curcas]
MEVAMEFEDDLLFADLSKQISLLIMDDDEDPVANYPSVSFQDFSRGNCPAAASSFVCEQRRESKGTGVFIPRSSQPRRKDRQGRHSSFNSSKSNRLHQDNTRMVSQVSYSNSLYPKKG